MSPLSDKPPQSASVNLMRAEACGRVFKVGRYGEKMELPEGREAPRRGLCAPEMSDRARKRFMDRVQRLDPVVVQTQCLFITLTYRPEDCSPDPRIWKGHIHSFYKAAVRQFGDHLMMEWKLEPHESGLPHFHLLLLGVRYWNKFDLGRLWGRVSGFTPYTKEGGVLVDFPRVDVQRPRNGRDLSAYVAKYITKKLKKKAVDETAGAAGDPCLVSGPYLAADGEPIENVGRTWGVYGRKNASRYECAEVEKIMDRGRHWSVYLKVRRACRKMIEKREGRGCRMARFLRGGWSMKGFTIYSDSTSQLMALMDYFNGESMADYREDLKAGRTFWRELRWTPEAVWALQCGEALETAEGLVLAPY